MRKALVCGASGLIGQHLVNRLKADGYFVWGIDRRRPEFAPSQADNLIISDLRAPPIAHDPVFTHCCWDEVYQCAAEMGGAEYIFVGDNDADIMRNSALINLNVLESCKRAKVGGIFFCSSACAYPDYIQSRTDSVALKESMLYPARPDSAYGWEKLFSQGLYDAYARNFGLRVRVGLLHNVHGPFCTWQHGREKAPAAICRKVALASRSGGTIDIFGDGEQTRSFLHIDECIEGIRRLMASEVSIPLNIGSSEMITINDLVHMVADIAGKKIKINHIDGPQGVRGRSSNNDLIREKLGWAPSAALRAGMEKTYAWVSQQVLASQKGVDNVVKVATL
jgi:GDP-D-mannose 3',5'-epimerase